MGDREARATCMVAIALDERWRKCSADREIFERVDFRGGAC
jgi:hypothetical protein